MTPTADTQTWALRQTLHLAVPLWIRDLEQCAPPFITAVAQEAATVIATHGDDLQFGGKHCASTFNALARGLAAAALTADGGVDYLGLHWCTTPHCPAASRFDHADDGPHPPAA